MNKNLLLLAGVFAILCTCEVASAQTDLAPDQNPNYAVSRAKYMEISDSITGWQSTTRHEMYKAIDWLADRKEARADRREFRRQLRLERARWIDYNDGYYFPTNFYYGNHRSFNRYNQWRRNRSFGFYPNLGLNFWWR